MNVLRSRDYALALLVVAAVGCSEPPAAPAPSTIHYGASTRGGPFAVLASKDPTAIPIGSPARVDFVGRVAGSRRSIHFPLTPAPTGEERLVETARAWLASPDQPGRTRTAESRGPVGRRYVAGLLAATTPAEIRAALGPDRGRVTVQRTLKRRSHGLSEHDATFRVGGRDVLRVVTLARPTGHRALFACADDPNDVTDSGEPCWGEPAPEPAPDASYDPYFDPEPVVSDVVTMQAAVDAASADVDALDRAAGGADCKEERAAFLGSSLAFGWRAGETVFYAWMRNVPKTYSSLRDASFLFGTTWALYLRYKQCMSGKPAAPRGT